MTYLIKKTSKKLYKGALLGILGVLGFFFKFQDGGPTEIISPAYADNTGPGGSGGASGPGSGSGPSGCSGGCGSGPCE